MDIANSAVIAPTSQISSSDRPAARACWRSCSVSSADRVAITRARSTMARCRGFRVAAQGLLATWSASCGSGPGFAGSRRAPRCSRCSVIDPVHTFPVTVGCPADLVRERRRSRRYERIPVGFEPARSPPDAGTHPALWHIGEPSVEVQVGGGIRPKSPTLVSHAELQIP